MKYWSVLFLILLSGSRVTGQDLKIFDGKWNITDPFYCTGHAVYTYYTDFSTGKKVYDRAFSLTYADELSRLKIQVTGSFLNNVRDGRWEMSFDFTDYPYGDDGLLNGYMHITQNISNGIPHGDWIASNRVAITGTGPTPRESSFDEESVTISFNRGIITGNVVCNSSSDGVSKSRMIRTDSLGCLHGKWSNDYSGITEVSEYNHGFPVRIVNYDQSTGDSTVKIYTTHNQLQTWEKACPLMISDPYLFNLIYESFNVRFKDFDDILEGMFFNEVVTSLGIPGEVKWDRERNFNMVFLYQERSGAGNLCRVGDYYLSHADTVMASAWYSRAAAENPDNGTGYYKLGLIAENKDDIYSALLNYSKASLTNYPEANSAIMRYGSTLLKKGNYSAAKESFRLLTMLNPQHGAAWGNLGWIYIEEDSIPQAISAFEYAESIGPTADIFAGRLVCTYLTGEKKQLRQLYETGRNMYSTLYPAENLYTGLLRKDYIYTEKQRLLIGEVMKKLK